MILKKTKYMVDSKRPSPGAPFFIKNIKIENVIK